MTWLGFMAFGDMLEPPPFDLDIYMESVVSKIEMIRARAGNVIFIERHHPEAIDPERPNHNHGSILGLVVNAD